MLLKGKPNADEIQAKEWELMQPLEATRGHHISLYRRRGYNGCESHREEHVNVPNISIYTHNYLQHHFAASPSHLSINNLHISVEEKIKRKRESVAEVYVPFLSEMLHVKKLVVQKQKNK